MDTNQIHITIKDNTLHNIDDNLFGQMLEKTPIEPGPECAVNLESGQLHSHIDTIISELNIPLMSINLRAIPVAYKEKSLLIQLM